MSSPTAAPSRPRVIILAGPTAVGKSSTAMDLATSHPSPLGKAVEIVSADSVHVYRNLDIASNKPSLADRSRVPHHLVDTHSPSSANTAGTWLSAAHAAIADVAARGRVPLVVGGTMMYLRWLVHGKPATPAPSEDAVKAVDIALEGVAGDWDAGLELLRGRDPVRAAQLTKNDWYRLRRALQVVEETSCRLSSGGGVRGVVTQNAGESSGGVLPVPERSGCGTTVAGVGVGGLPVVGAAPGKGISREEMAGDFRCFFLFDDRVALNRRIDRRCEGMILPLHDVCSSAAGAEGGGELDRKHLNEKASILTEVASLLISRSISTADGSPARAIGYRQTIMYLLKRAQSCFPNTPEPIGIMEPSADPREEFRSYVDEFQQATRGYAKQQIQWFRKEPGYIWIRGGENAGRTLADLFALSEEEFVEKVEQDDFRTEQSRLRADMIAQGKEMKVYTSKKETLVEDSAAEDLAVSLAESLARSVAEALGREEISRIFREMGRGT